MRKGITVLAAMLVLLGILPSAWAASSPPSRRVYTTSADFNEGTLVGVEDTTVPDQLQLSKDVTTLPFIWIPNSNGTVSKVHTETGHELGRYRVTPPGLPEAGSPSRTTVDLEGNVWVGNRAAGTVVKIGLLEGGQCVDRNGNGTIDTARDLNNDGDIIDAEVLSWGSDECVLYEVVLLPGQEAPHIPGTYTGPYDTNYWGVSPRSLAVDSRNNLWAGTGSSQKFYYINGATGEILDVLDLARWGFQAYGATIDRDGLLWSVHPLLRIDPAGLGIGVSSLATAPESTQTITGNTGPYGARNRTATAWHYPPGKAAPKAEGAAKPDRPYVHPVTPKTHTGSPVMKPAETLFDPAAAGDVLVYTAFNTTYTYNTADDSVANILAEMRTGVNSSLYHQTDGTAQSVQDPILDLSSAYPLSQVFSSGNPSAPPAGVDYRWTFPAVPEGRGEWADGQTDQTATLMTGMTVSRAVDQRQFTGSGPFTQTLTVSVTPAEAMNSLMVYGRADVNGLDATISSVSGENFNLYPDGRGFDAVVNNPVVGQTYAWQVTITITSLPAGFRALDYLPDFQANAVVTIGQGESAGSSVTGNSRTQAGDSLAAWSWQSTGAYRWFWEQHVSKQVHLSGSATDPLRPEAEVNAGFATIYQYQSPDDAVSNSPVQMRADVNTNLYNFHDGSGLPVVDPIVDLSSSYTIRLANASGQPLAPPAGVEYRWGFPNIGEGAGEFAQGQTDQTAVLAPGFTASRTVDQRDFMGPGTQTLTLSVTPVEPMDGLSIHMQPDVNGLSAVVLSVDGENASIAPDGRGVNAFVDTPAVGKLYVWKIVTQIRSLPEGYQALRYVPGVWVQGANRTAEGIHDGSSITRDTEFATWAWQATGNYRWHWQQQMGKAVNFEGSVADPFAPSAQLYANFETTYTHFTQEDIAANPTAELQAAVHSQLNNRNGGAGPAVTDAIVDLSSDLSFQGSWSSGESLTPPDGVDYRWKFASIPDGSGVYAGGQLDQSTMMATGLTVTRTVDQRRFTGPGTQLLTLSVTPQEAGRALSVNGNVNVDGLDAVVTEVTGESAYAFPDGRGFGAWVENPTPGHSYVWTVTIAIRSLPADYRTLDFEPEIRVRNVQRVSEGTNDGDHVTVPSLDLSAGQLATWAWQAAGNYRWHWRQEVSKEVHMWGSNDDPNAPIRRIQLNAGEYALAPDYLGNLFVTGYEQNTLSKVETATGEVIWVKQTPQGCARGVAITTDNQVWVADTCRNSVLRYDNDGNLIAEITGLSQPSGVAVDALGKVWSTDLGSENIHRIDPQTNAIDLTKRLVMSGNHYSYSDMTGMVSRTVSTTTGTWTVVHDSSRAGTPWGTVDWTASEPAGAAITVRVRSSEDQSAWSAWETAADGAALTQTPNGRYIQIEATFRLMSGDVSPVLYDLTVSPAHIAVPVDIKPTSCPNPLNLTDSGSLPAAILGAPGFDASRIAPETVRLAGVAPTRWSLEDVATPYGGVIADPPDRMNCTTDGKDGHPDLTLKFDAEAIIAALGDVSDGDMLVLQLTGQLLDGTPILGEDVVWIVRQGQKAP